MGETRALSYVHKNCLHRTFAPRHIVEAHATDPGSLETLYCAWCTNPHDPDESGDGNFPAADFEWDVKPKLAMTHAGNGADPACAGCIKKGLFASPSTTGAPA